MKSKKDLNFTYMGHLQNAWYANDVAEQHEINKLLSQFKHLGNVYHHTMPLFFAIDYTAQQYLIMTDAMQVIAGYHPREFIESKLQKLIDVYHKDDFKIYNHHVFARNLEFLKQTPQHQHSQYIFSNTFRFIRSDKKYAHVLQRGTYITSKETGLPLYSLGMVIDINHFKTDNIIVHTIEKMNRSNDITDKNLIEVNHFYPDQEEAAFTRREVNVLQYIAEGLSSKQIAGKLNISENTVVNHKQNMMRKSSAKNTSELIVLAVRNRII